MPETSTVAWIQKIDYIGQNIIQTLLLLYITPEDNSEENRLHQMCYCKIYDGQFFVSIITELCEEFLNE